MRQRVPDLRHFKGPLRFLRGPPIQGSSKEYRFGRAMRHLARSVLVKMAGVNPMPEYARSIGTIEQVLCGWGYDSAGRWHRGVAKVVPIRKTTLLTEKDPLALVRGSLWGVLLSFLFFWLPAGAVAFLLSGK